MSQTLWADAIYVKDVRRRQEWSERILQAAAFVLHELYQAFDLTTLLQEELDRRNASNLCEFHLASLLLTQPGLAVAV